jgi:hypothetical protein
MGAASGPEDDPDGGERSRWQEALRLELLEILTEGLELLGADRRLGERSLRSTFLSDA